MPVALVKKISRNKKKFLSLTIISTFQTTRSSNNEFIPKHFLIYIYPMIYIFFFSGIPSILITSEYHFIAQASKQAVHFGTGQFGLDLEFGKITSLINVLTPSLSVDLLFIIIY